MLKLSHALALTVATDELVKLYEDVDTARLGKALHLAAEHKVAYRDYLRCYLYQSPTQSLPYVISLNRVARTNDLRDGSCTCDDHINRGVVCKHILAAWLTRRVEDILGAAEQLRTVSQIDTLDRYIQWAFS